MKLFSLFAGAAGALVLGASPALAAPLEAYGRLPQIEDVAISPNGAMLALIVTDGEKRTVIIQDATTNQPIAALNAGGSKLRYLQWGGDGYLLITGSSTAHMGDVFGPREEHFVTHYYDIKGKREHGLLDGIENALNVTLGEPQVRIVNGAPRVIVEGITFSDGGVGHVSLFQVELVNGRIGLIEEGATDTSDWKVGANGQAVAQSQYDDKTNTWNILLKRGGRWQSVLHGDAKLGGPDIISLGRDGKSLLIDENNEDTGDSKLREYSVDTASWGETLPLHFTNLINDDLSNRLIGAERLAGDDTTYTFFNPADQAIWDGIVKAYPGDDVHLQSWSSDHRHVVVRVESPTEGPAYALVDLTTKHAGWIGSVYRGIGEADVSPVKPVSYKAADGAQITGYLTLPKGREAKGLPLIVLPHGGPAARDVREFDWWSQALASRGYAVLQPNYRGSSGFGWAFLSSGFGQWGRKMQTDLSDGVRYLAAEGVIDPKRVCIAGASYGGYAALAGATIDRGVYRCAVDVSGPADLPRFLSTAKSDNGETSFRYWNRFMGVDGPRDAKLAEISPAALADKVTIPVLVIHGKADTVVGYDQSQAITDALRRAGKPVEFVTLDGEDHWLSRGETRLKMLQAMTAFMEKNNPPG